MTLNFLNNFKLFKKLNENTDVIIYLEFDSDWNHIQHIAEKLLHLNKNILIINSGNDSFQNYKSKFKNLNIINIDRGVLRTFIFNYFKADAVILSITDLNNSFLRKSKFVKKYIYVFHSITSTHMCYKENAFDNYDVLMCVGEHQIKEIKKREKIKNLKKKKIIKYFHNRIYSLYNFHLNSKINYSEKSIIISSSWGEGSIVENLDQSFIISLLENKYEILLQFHHMQLNHLNKIKIDYKKLKEKYKNFDYSFNYVGIADLYKFGTMISDWSGAATEFALGFERKVIFFDLPKKIRNQKYKLLEIEPLEISIRNEIGVVVSLNDLTDLANIVKSIISNQKTLSVKEEIVNVRQKYLFPKSNNEDLINIISN